MGEDESMSVIKRMRKQDAVYWPFVSVDNFAQKVVGSPVQIRCRWDNVTQEFLDSSGEIQMSNAVVYPDRDTPIGGILMRGVLADITDAVDIKENEGAWEIRRFDDTPNFKASEFLKTAYL